MLAGFVLSSGLTFDGSSEFHQWTADLGRVSGPLGEFLKVRKLVFLFPESLVGITSLIHLLREHERRASMADAGPELHRVPLVANTLLEMPRAFLPMLPA